MKCPGSGQRFWGPEAAWETGCPKCGGPIEFFKDESSRKCRKCGEKVLNPKMDFGCAVYCKFASQCLGQDMPPELLAKRADLLKDRAATEVKKFLGRNFRRIGRMLKVIEYADKIQKAEGGDPAIVILAACLSATAGVFSGSEGQGARFSTEDVRFGQDPFYTAPGRPDEVTRRSFIHPWQSRMVPAPGRIWPISSAYSMRCESLRRPKPQRTGKAGGGRQW